MENDKLMSMQNLDVPVELIKVGVDTFALRDWDFKVGFVKDTANGKLELVQILRDKTIFSRNPQLDKGEKVPLELILKGDFEAGVKAYQ